MQHYQNNEDGYRQWKQTNPTGFVLVSHNPPSGEYLTLHRADGGSLNPHDTDTKNWTVKYVKICSADRAEIEQWAAEKLSSTATPCGHCVRANRL